MENIPILHMGDFLLVTIQTDIHDQNALDLQNNLTQRIVETGAQGVLIDISAVDIVDSYIARVIGNIAQMSQVLDAETVLTGMQPSVAITLVEMGVTLKGVRTAINAQKGMAMLRKIAEGAQTVPHSQK